VSSRFRSEWKNVPFDQTLLEIHERKYGEEENSKKESCKENNKKKSKKDRNKKKSRS